MTEVQSVQIWAKSKGFSAVLDFWGPQITANNYQLCKRFTLINEVGKWALWLIMYKDPITFHEVWGPVHQDHPIPLMHILMLHYVALSHHFPFYMSTFTLLALQWFSSTPETPPILSPSLQIPSHTPSRLTNCPLLVSTSKNTQSWPPTQNHSQIIGRKSSFPKSSISTACHSPWKVYLDIDSVITYVWEYVLLIHLPFFHPDCEPLKTENSFSLYSITIPLLQESHC